MRYRITGDFMKNYIKMCKELKELQDNWTPRCGDLYCLSYEENRPLPIESYRCKLDGTADKKDVMKFLPSLVQLFDMAKIDEYSHIVVADWGVSLRFRVKPESSWQLPRTVVIDFSGKRNEAMLKLIARLKWNLNWDEEKEVWMEEE